MWPLKLCYIYIYLVCPVNLSITVLGGKKLFNAVERQTSLICCCRQHIGKLKSAFASKVTILVHYKRKRFFCHLFCFSSTHCRGTLLHVFMCIHFFTYGCRWCNLSWLRYFLTCSSHVASSLLNVLNWRDFPNVNLYLCLPMLSIVRTLSHFMLSPRRYPDITRILQSTTYP